MRPRIVLVTDPGFADEVVVRCIGDAARVLPAGALCVQLRDKARPLTSLRLFALQLRAVTADAGAALVVNGDPRLARDVGADGVHLGGDARARGVSVREARSVCGDAAWVSVAAHSDDDVQRARDEGADAALVSPIFDSHPHRAMKRLSATAADDPDFKQGRGLGALRRARIIARASSQRPGPALSLYALGGVTVERARACMEAGADGIAVIRALLGSDEPGRSARAFHDAVAAHC
ncbi:MAG: thiamine phosphate synthase [Myxococcales bacterium]|nr:thiamine phosphate synthase [Myxococcales bacterium]